MIYTPTNILFLGDNKMAKRKLPDMEANYNAKVKQIASRWKEVTPKKRKAFAEGVAYVLGVSPEEIKRADDWEKGVNRVSEEAFLESIKGKGHKLAENYKIAMTTD